MNSIPISRLTTLMSRYISERSPGLHPRTVAAMTNANGVLLSFLNTCGKELDRDSMVQFLSFCTDRYKPSTARKMFSLISRLCRWLADYHREPISLMHGLRLRTRPTPQRSIFQFPFDRYHQVIRAHCDEAAYVFMVAYHTGLSTVDCCHLRWSDVDLDDGLITIHRAKTGTMSRIPIMPDSRLHEYLTQLRERWVKSARNRMRNGLEASDDELVHPKAAKMYKQTGCLATRLRRALASAKLPQVQFHDLRRHFISRHLNRGTDPTVLAQMTGHSTLQSVMRYATISTDTIRKAFHEAEAQAEADV